MQVSAGKMTELLERVFGRNPELNLSNNVAENSIRPIASPRAGGFTHVIISVHLNYHELYRLRRRGNLRYSHRRRPAGCCHPDSEAGCSQSGYQTPRWLAA